MNILVTGGCGYIGSIVTKKLSESGKRVVVYDNLSTGSKSSLLNNEVLVTGELSDLDKLSTVMSEYKIDSVFHFAASISVEESVANPLFYYENNTSNTVKILQACLMNKINRLIFSSTAAVYGNSSSPLVTEESECQPTSPYGRSKLMDEWIIADTAHSSALKYVIMRYFNVAGANQSLELGQRSPVATHLIRLACQAALGAKDCITIFGNDYPTRDGTCIRDFIHVEDLADAHIAGLNYLNDNAQNLIVNCGSENGYTVAEVIQSVKRVSGMEFPIKYGPRRPGDISNLIACSSKLRELLKWEPKHNDIDTIVKSSLEWEKTIQLRHQ